MKVRATITIELLADDLDSVSDLIHETWSSGDAGDELKACITVDDSREVLWFSYESEAEERVHKAGDCLGPPMCRFCRVEERAAAR